MSANLHRPLQLAKTYFRALRMLASEWHLSFALALASVAIAGVQLAEPVLFGRVVDSVARGEPSAPLILAWALLGLFGIMASVVVAVFADRLAHRRRTRPSSVVAALCRSS